MHCKRSLFLKHFSMGNVEVILLLLQYLYPFLFIYLLLPFKFLTFIYSIPSSNPA